LSSAAAVVHHHRPQRPPSSSAAALVVVCHCPPHGGFRSSDGYRVPAFFSRILHVFGRALPHFTNTLRTAYLDHPLVSTAVVTAVNADTAVGGTVLPPT